VAKLHHIPIIVLEVPLACHTFYRPDSWAH